MTVRELYESIGGNYDSAKRILMNDAMIARFIKMLPDDRSCERMIAAGEEMDADGLFQGAHAMKGVCANLGLDELSRAAGEITEEFRPGNPRRLSDDEVRGRLAEIRARYGAAVDAIRRFAAEQA